MRKDVTNPNGFAKLTHSELFVLLLNILSEVTYFLLR